MPHEKVVQCLVHLIYTFFFPLAVNRIARNVDKNNDITFQVVKHSFLIVSDLVFQPFFSTMTLAYFRKKYFVTPDTSYYFSYIARCNSLRRLSKYPLFYNLVYVELVVQLMELTSY